MIKTKFDDGWFEYKGINSLSMHLKIVNDISFPSPEADIEFIEVLGRDGELAVDNERLKGVNFPIPVQLKPPKGIDVNIMATKISEWLKSDTGWYPLRFSGLKGYEYIAMCYEQFDIQETLKQYGKTVINFRLKPYKRRIDSNSVEITNGMSLYNREIRASKPLIKIEGSGDISLKNNGKEWLELRSIDGSITVDSEMMSVYKGTRPQFGKMISTLTPMFPLLNHGENTITWKGNVTKIEIEPRWEAII